MTGGVLSILMVIGTELVSPAPLVAEQVKVTPAVSAAGSGCTLKKMPFPIRDQSRAK